MSMMRGAIQVSIGFLIVMVISALVMIFMMSWISGMFPQITKISEFATSQAQQQMINEFSKGNDVILATIPYEQKFQPGSEVQFKVGVKKMNVPDENNFFATCIGAMEAVTCVTTDRPTPMSVCDTNRDGVLTPTEAAAGSVCGIQFKMDPNTRIDDRNDIKLLAATMVIPQKYTVGSGDGATQYDLDKGTYGYKIYVCSSPTLTTGTGNNAQTFRCNGLTSSSGEYDFIVQVA